MTTTTSPTERVGRYQLLEPIGIGPSGAVSRAKVFGVAGFERQFAVKRFHAELTATAAMAAMLSAAARSYGSLEHPRIARMSEFGVAQGSTFTAVEYVPGLDALRLIGEAKLAGVSLAAGGALALVSQAARAVGYAHGRGLTHLGLAPTNVIVTAEGDIKITDFGILSATLPQRPIEVPRLAQRIPYLAPEQLANEATSAATDVFALGVLAYELVTGTRTFRGDTPQQVASAIMAGPPAEPPLPRPIVRVLQRCLARSPFERFPDARSLADALDAALRVAPVPGTRKDIGAQVKDTLDRLAALNEGQMSGMVAIHLGTGPVRRVVDDDTRRIASSGRDLEPPPDPAAAAPYELGQPDPGLGGPGMPGAGATLSDLPRPMTTVPGLPPPPIPVPPGLAPPSIPPQSGQPGTGTLHGMGKVPPPTIPTIKPRAGSVSGIPPVPPAARRAPTRPEIDLELPIEPAPPAPPALRPALTTESAVHPLDPSDLLSFESSSEDDVEGGPTVHEAAPPMADRDEPAPSRPARGASAADDFLDGPTHAVSSDEQAVERPATPATAYRLDQSSVDTRPIPPVTLEPLLFDPIERSPEQPGNQPADHPGDRAAEPPSRRAGSRAERASDRADRDAEPLDQEQEREDADNRAPSVPASEPSAGSGRIAVTPIAGQTAGPDPRLGRTMVGFAAPATGPRAAAPSPRGMPVSTEGHAAPPAPGAPPTWSPASGSAEEDALPGPSMPPAVGPEAPPPPQPAGWVQAPPQPLPPTGPTEARPKRHAAWIVIGVIGAVTLGIATWQLYARVIAPSGGGTTAVATAPGDARKSHTAGDSARVVVTPADASQAPAAADATLPLATTPPDARAGAPRDATAASDSSRVAAATTPDAAAPPLDARAATGDATKIAATSPGPPAAPGAGLKISSTPPGARVFLDGADSGATPLALPGSPDRHNIALLLAGHELYLAQVDGHGTFQIPLKEVTPTNGPAGIKVLRCKDKDRYYVFVDGKPTGQTCPTERIGCEVGPHTVEVYDVVSETRRKWDVVVKDTRLSFRVRVE